jgi:hypothetical protein
MDLAKFCTEENKSLTKRETVWRVPSEYSTEIEAYALSLGVRRSVSGELFVASSKTNQNLGIKSHGRNNDKYFVFAPYTKSQSSQVLHALAQAAIEASN